MTFYASRTGVGDQGFLTLLENAGHSVNRHSPPASGAILSADVAQINTHDLIIAARAINSTAFDTDAEAAPWNTLVTRPSIYQSAYLMRANRLGTSTESTLQNGTPARLTATDLNDLVTAYIFGGVPRTGNTTAEPYDEAIDQNTTQTFTDPVGAVPSRFDQIRLE